MPQHYCDIEELFTEISERTTKQKHALLEKLLSMARAWTANQLWHSLGPKWGNMTTLRRNLNHLKKHGLIQIAFDDGKQPVYERANDKHHDHLKCTNCGIYQCVPCADPKPASRMPIKITAHQLLFEGRCTHCS